MKASNFSLMGKPQGTSWTAAGKVRAQIFKSICLRGSWVTTGSPDSIDGVSTVTQWQVLAVLDIKNRRLANFLLDHICQPLPGACIHPELAKPIVTRLKTTQMSITSIFVQNSHATANVKHINMKKREPRGINNGQKVIACVYFWVHDGALC